MEHVYYQSSCNPDLLVQGASALDSMSKIVVVSLVIPVLNSFWMTKNIGRE